MKKGVDCKGNCWEECSVGRKKDLTGYKFTKLTVLFPVCVKGRSAKHYYWLCVCDCGNEIACRTDCLNNQHIQSCGCMIVEGVYKKSQMIIDEMIGQRFGKLRVMEFAGYKKVGIDAVGRATFRCECDCGNDNFIVEGLSLRNGLTLSCGCLNRSIGELNIESILKENKILFKSEYTFLDLISKRDGYLRYDFAILDTQNNIPTRLIEFDGIQHIRPCDYFGGEEQFKITQENDMLKNQYALSHNIPLVRIPYSLRDTMILEDLMGDSYLITQDCIVGF